MNTGSPPTAPNARAGLLTPPGISPRARAKAARLRGRSTEDGFVLSDIDRFRGRASGLAAGAQALAGQPGEGGDLRVGVAGVEGGDVAVDARRLPRRRRVGVRADGVGLRHLLLDEVHPERLLLLGTGGGAALELAGLGRGQDAPGAEVEFLAAVLVQQQVV